MVTTFLVCADYAQSASCLDKKRLGKQRVEARQILHALLDLYIIAKHFPDLPQPPIQTNYESVADLYYDRCVWVKNLRKAYLSQDVRLVEHRVGHSTSYKKVPCTHFLIRKKDDIIKKHKTKYVVTRDSKTKDYPRPKYYLLNSDERSIERGISAGYSQHAAVRMWVGYEDSLKHYINVHIDEWCSRTNKNGEFCKNNMEKYSVDLRVIETPWWQNWDALHSSHKIALLLKELSRNEPKHYVLSPLVTQVSPIWLQHGYIWTGNMSRKHIRRALKGTFISPKEICFPLNKDLLSGIPKAQKAVGVTKYKLDNEGYVELSFR